MGIISYLKDTRNPEYDEYEATISICPPVIQKWLYTLDNEHVKMHGRHLIVNYQELIHDDSFDEVEYVEYIEKQLLAAEDIGQFNFICMMYMDASPKQWSDKVEKWRIYLQEQEQAKTDD